MATLSTKIDFVEIISVTNANPNGDPLNGNRPRENYDGYGEISDVCIKRKIRNRLQDMGQNIFVQSDDRAKDRCENLKQRANGCAELQDALSNKNGVDIDECIKIACNEWMDVRTFGQVFAFSAGKKGAGVSIGIRGPVSIHQSISVDPIDSISMQIVKSVNGDGPKGKKSPDTMGMKHRVGFGLYVIKGSINCQLAKKTGFSDEDAELIKEALRTLFENDASSARPEGSMEVCRLYWWKHDSKYPAVSTAKVHRSVKINKICSGTPKSFDDYEVTVEQIDGIEPEVIDCM